MRNNNFQSVEQLNDRTNRFEILLSDHDFDASELIKLQQGEDARTGAIASFIGQCREYSEREQITQMTLSYYPRMTVHSIGKLVTRAFDRWSLHRVLVVHRVGVVVPGENIVLVCVNSEHRHNAFAGCAFIMDYLKIEAPFWKKEQTKQGDRWVESRDSDQDAAKKWRFIE